MDTKICTKCKRELPIEDFYWRDKEKGLRRAECKYCHRTYVKNKYTERQNEINKIKSLYCCEKCGDNRPYVLDFHHKNPEEKEERISSFISHNRKAEDIKNEIRKCVILCANCHREFHYLEKEQNISLEDFLGEESNVIYPDEIFNDLEKTTIPTILSKSKNYCKMCGKEISRNATYCKECFSFSRRFVERPSREKLKDMIRTTSFTKIAEQYGVSDKAISKWCKDENLPYRKVDIKQYSDEEWINI